MENFLRQIHGEPLNQKKSQSEKITIRKNHNQKKSQSEKITIRKNHRKNHSHDIVVTNQQYCANKIHRRIKYEEQYKKEIDKEIDIW